MSTEAGAAAPKQYLRLVVTCTRCGGRDEVHFAADLYNRQFVELFGSMLDGSCPYFVRKPGPASPLGQCGKCHGPLRSTVL